MITPYKISKNKQAISELSAGLLMMIISLILTLLFLIVFGPNSYVFLIPALFFVLHIPLFLFTYIVRRIYLHYFSYEITNKSFIMCGGILAKFERIIPFSRIQHVVVSENILQRFFGLKSVELQDARSSNSEIYMDSGTPMNVSSNDFLPGLKKEDAEKLKDFIVKKILKSKTLEGL